MTDKESLIPTLVRHASCASPTQQQHTAMLSLTDTRLQLTVQRQHPGKTSANRVAVVRHSRRDPCCPLTGNST
jgi:hypothetical protein